MSVITKPVIHLNGTSPQYLKDCYVDAKRAVDAAYEAVLKCSPNGRDYYVAPGTLSKAVHENMVRLEKLTHIAEELMDLAEHCNQYVK